MQADAAQVKKRRGAAELPGFIAVDGQKPLPCIITDETPSGASLLTRNAEIPDCFNLIMIGRGDLSRPCKVVRRAGNLIRVDFPRLIDKTA